MVKTADIVQSNARFADEHHEGRVCVFAGATTGIGFGTLRKMLTLLHSSTFYVLGRSEARFADQLAKLRALAPRSKVIFLETQVSLIAEIDAVCKKITAAERKVDYVCMSMGGMPFQGAVYTDEGLEQCFALSYYARLRLVSNLLPLLHQSPRARILSVLNGTKEKRINENDLNLDQKWGIVAVVNHTTICTSLAFDYLAAHDAQQHLTFIHATPGFVNTGTPRTTYPSKKDGVLWWALMSVLQVVSGWIIVYFGASLQESGERHSYYLTSDDYKPGSWRTDRHNEIVPDNDAFKYYKERGWMEKIWDFTQQVWDKTLAKGH